MLLGSLALALLSAALWRRTTESTLVSAFIAFSLLLSLLISGIYFFADSLSGAGIDESVLFHLRADLEGAGFAEFGETIFFAALYLAIALAVAAYVFVTAKSDEGRTKPKMRAVLALSALTGSFAVNPGTHDIAYLASTYSSFDDSGGSRSVSDLVYPDDYFLIDNKSLELNNRNLVYIYLESVERTYLNEEIFPGLTPNLSAIEAESLSFTNIHQTVASNWTIAGMVNSQCSVPLVVPGGQGNSMSGAARFLPRANCLGDVLKQNGYRAHYIGGSNKDFAGKGNFYLTHGFDQVEGVWDFAGKIKPTPSLPPEFITKGLYRSAWGLYDDTLFEEVKDRYSELSESLQPFALFALTLDTHHPDGHVSKYCADVIYQDGANLMLNAIHCADKLIGHLYQFITQHSGFENTILVIASDHLAMPNSARSLLAQGDRKNLFLVRAKDIAPALVETPAAQVDTAPTMLNLLGADIAGLGFGRDLFSQDSLIVRYGTVPTFNHKILKHRKFLFSLWDFPQLDGGIKVKPYDREFLLGEDALKFPALILVNNDFQVESVRFEFWTSKKLGDHFLGRDPNQAFIWIDSCANLSSFYSEPAGKMPEFCLAIGRFALGQIDKTRAEFFPLEGNITLSREQVIEIFDDLERTAEPTRQYPQPSPQSYGGLMPPDFDLARDASRLPRVARTGGKRGGEQLHFDSANSFELLDLYKATYRLFEVDLSWTQDNKLVCLRDWQDSFEAIFGIAPEGKKSRAEFLRLVKSESHFTQCTLDSLADWLLENPEPKVVLVVREEPVKAYQLIAKAFPSLQSRFIPTASSPNDYREISQLGYKEIIWNVFRSKLPNAEIVTIAGNIKPYAILMPRERAETGLARSALDKAHIPSYVATINFQSELVKYEMLGVSEVFTDLPSLSYGE